LAQQPRLAPRLPVVPALAPRVVQRSPLTYLGQAPVVTQPFAPLSLLPAPQSPPPLTLNPTLLTALTSPPKVTPSPGQGKYDVVTTTSPPAVVSTPPQPTALVTALPELVAELSPPSLQKVERPITSQ